MQGQQIIRPKETRQLWEKLLKVRESRQREQQTKFKKRYVLPNLDCSQPWVITRPTQDKLKLSNEQIYKI